MMIIEKKRKRRIITQMNQKDHHLELAKKDRERSLDQKRRENYNKQLEKKRNVEKILKQQEKERQMTLKRIEQKAQSIQALQREKNSNKWAIEKQRIVEEFEKMKKTGKLNYKTLSKLGVELPSKKEIKEDLKMRVTRSTFAGTISTSDGVKQRRLSQPGSMRSTNNHKNNHFTSVKTQSTGALEPNGGIKRNSKNISISHKKPGPPKILKSPPNASTKKTGNKPVGSPYAVKNSPSKKASKKADNAHKTSEESKEPMKETKMSEVGSKKQNSEPNEIEEDIEKPKTDIKKPTIVKDNPKPVAAPKPEEEKTHKSKPSASSVAGSSKSAKKKTSVKSSKAGSGTVKKSHDSTGMKFVV